MALIRNFILFCSVIFLLNACTTPSTKSVKDNVLIANKLIDSTKNFKIFKGTDYYLLEVKTLFSDFDGHERYIFYSKDHQQPNLKGVTHYFSTPVERLTISSTTHLGFLNELQKSASIKGAKNLTYAYDSTFINRMKVGKVINLGENAYDVERLVQLNPELNLGYAFESQGYKEIMQLRKKGEKFLLVDEFMEETPLDKAKWLLPIALLYGEETFKKAQIKVDKIGKRYRTLKKRAEQSKTQPSIMIGLPWKGNWFVSGGDSFQARFIADAKGDYLWKSNPSKGSIPLSMEKIFQDALEADYWINPGPTKTLGEILDRDNRFTEFKAFQEHEVFNQNKRLSASGGNDYWESGVIHPDYILADLISIFHPELMSDHQFYYYQKLQP